MAELRCKKCGSTNVKKNGTKPGGGQQYHCRDCGVYTTTDAYAQAHAAKLSQVDELHHERKRAICYTDEYEVYRKVLPAARHRACPKGSGATSLLDRCHLTLRNWCVKLTRKTLAVSQLVTLHATRIRMVVDHYNALHVGLS